MRLWWRAAGRLMGRIWSLARAVSGDDAYERYCAHRAARHAREPLLSRRAFYDQEQQRKWSGVSRCC